MLAHAHNHTHAAASQPPHLNHPQLCSVDTEPRPQVRLDAAPHALQDHQITPLRLGGDRRRHAREVDDAQVVAAADDAQRLLGERAGECCVRGGGAGQERAQLGGGDVVDGRQLVGGDDNLLGVHVVSV